MNIQWLLTDSSKWTQNALAKTSKNELTWQDDLDAVCWSLLGAIRLCYPFAEQGYIIQRVYDYLNLHYAPHKDIPWSDEKKPMIFWNDEKTRTFADVRKLIEDLGI